MMIGMIFMTRPKLEVVNDMRMRNKLTEAQCQGQNVAT